MDILLQIVGKMTIGTRPHRMVNLAIAQDAAKGDESRFYAV